MESTQNNTFATDFDAILDTTVETKLSERAQFAQFQAKLEADRAEARRRFEPKTTETQRFARLTEAL